MIKRDKDWWLGKAVLEGDHEVGAGAPTSMLDDLDEDSENFSDDEVKSAFICQNEDQVIAHIRSHQCPQCGGAMEPMSHALRRKTGKHYWKMALGCLHRHVAVPVVVRADWLF